MAKTEVQDVSVRERVEVDLSPREVEAALRHWLCTTIAPDRAPMPNDPTEVYVRVQTNDEGGVEGATLSYAPAPWAPKKETSK